MRPARVGTVAALVLFTAVALQAAAPARSDHGVLFCEPGRILAEPTHTRGRSNRIRWEAVEGKCWNHGTDRRFIVTITSAATGAKETVTVRGGDSVDATVEADDFPGGAIDGQRFSYRVVRKSERCLQPGPFGTCFDETTDSSSFANEVASIQDDRAPTGSLALAGGRTYVRSLEVPATVSATDPGAAASGPGYVAFGASGPRGCGAVTGCAAVPLGPGLTVRLEPGPDGIRTVEGRVYDRARGPADDPGATTIGTPPGNVSASFNDSIFLDRTAPYIFLRASTVKVTVGVPVTFEASQTVDPEGSGVLPGSGAWDFGDGGRATSLVASHTYTRTGKFTLRFSVADQVGNVGQTEVPLEVFAVAVPPEPRTTETPPQAPPPATVDRRPPAFSALAVRRRGGRATVAFRLSERATVRVEVRRLLPRPVRRMASLSRQLGAGRRGIVLPAASTRKPGRYAIVLVARDRAGNVSRTHTLRLTTR